MIKAQCLHKQKYLNLKNLLFGELNFQSRFLSSCEEYLLDAPEKIYQRHNSKV